MHAALCFVYDYYPGSFTLAQRYFPVASSKRPAVSAPDESVLWSYIVQVVSALSSVHLAGLSLRGALDTRRITITFDSGKEFDRQQIARLYRVARVVSHVATNGRVVIEADVPRRFIERLTTPAPEETHDR